MHTFLEASVSDKTSLTLQLILDPERNVEYYVIIFFCLNLFLLVQTIIRDIKLWQRFLIVNKEGGLSLHLSSIFVRIVGTNKKN